MVYNILMKKSTRRGHKTSAKTPVSAIINRRASFDYELGDTLNVGLVLTGAETKSARLGHVNLRGSYVTARENPATKRYELYLLNAGFSLPSFATKSSNQAQTTVDTRSRKILAKRREIEKFIAAKNDGFTIIPTKLLTRGHYIKLIIALGKGKKKYDKRESIKRKDIARENAKSVKYIKR